jgi:hypothetical protein
LGPGNKNKRVLQEVKLNIKPVKSLFISPNQLETQRKKRELELSEESEGSDFSDLE